MSGNTADGAERPPIRRRVDKHEEALTTHDRRISRNENWRLQAQGALKVLALIVGSGIIAYIFQLLI